MLYITLQIGRIYIERMHPIAAFCVHIVLLFFERLTKRIENIEYEIL